MADIVIERVVRGGCSIFTCLVATNELVVGLTCSNGRIGITESKRGYCRVLAGIVGAYSIFIFCESISGGASDIAY